MDSLITDASEPWRANEQFRIVEEDWSQTGYVRSKFVFRDGTSAYQTFPTGRYTSENVELIAERLFATPHLRQAR